MRETSHQPGSLALSNNGDLSLYFVGCGSAFSRTMNQNNLLVVKGKDHLLIDCGTKTPQALYERRIDLTAISHFLITHSHADHIGGLEEVMMVNRYVTGRKPTMIINEAYQELLWNNSLRGGTAYSEVRNGEPLGFEDFWQIQRPQQLAGIERESWHTTLGSIDIVMPRTMHFPDNAQSWRDSCWSCAVLFDERVLFTSDTRFDPQLLHELDGRYSLEMIFHDCQFFKGGVHASLEELATLPSEMKSRMVLMHYSDNWQQFQGEVMAAGFRGLVKQGSSYTFPAVGLKTTSVSAR
ncbi:MAG: MBL fold metallo-hydrolase [Chromatiales bacterium]|nr:MBL fold metallo-hydrolase [Chromatiales bacterium]